MVVANDKWLTAAMSDDDMVAELLLRLKQARTTPAENPVVLSPLRWGIRRQRSRSSRLGSIKKVVDSARGSPTTPLSWSGGSGSGGGSASPSAATTDGFEETSRQATCSTSTGSGSKAVPANEITSSCSMGSKRKKTFLEFRDEKDSLLKQRLDLEKEIATLRTPFKEQSTRNQNLKRFKLDVNTDCVKTVIRDDSNRENIEQALDHQTIPSFASRNPEASLLMKDRSNPESWTAGKAAGSDRSFFLLPDLNMTPSEDDSLAEMLYGTS